MSGDTSCVPTRESYLETSESLHTSDGWYLDTSLSRCGRTTHGSYLHTTTVGLCTDTHRLDAHSAEPKECTVHLAYRWIGCTFW